MPCPDYLRLSAELEQERQFREFESARANRAEAEIARMRGELSFFGRRIAAFLFPRELRALATKTALGTPYRTVTRDIERRAARLRDIEEGTAPPPDPEDVSIIMDRIRKQLSGEPA